MIDILYLILAAFLIILLARWSSPFQGSAAATRARVAGQLILIGLVVAYSHRLPWENEHSRLIRVAFLAVIYLMASGSPRKKSRIADLKLLPPVESHRRQPRAR